LGPRQLIDELATQTVGVAVGILIVGVGVRVGGIVEVAQQFPKLGFRLHAVVSVGIEQYLPPLFAVIQVKPAEQGTPAPQISPQANGVGGVVGIGVAVGNL